MWSNRNHEFPQDDYFDKIDQEIAWANAAKLDITVAYSYEWGSSPQAVGCFDALWEKEKPRKGYPFNVEFSSSMTYGMPIMIVMQIR